MDSTVINEREQPAAEAHTSSRLCLLGAWGLKSLAALLLPAMLIVHGCGGSGDVDTLNVNLSGDQEALAVDTGAIGSATFTLDRTTRTLYGAVNVDGMTATIAHIHAGAAGDSGSVVLPLTVASGQMASLGSTVLTQAQLADLDAGNWYVNVHSAAHPTGEIRGQLGREVFTAKLSGTQETTPVNSAGSGTGFLALNSDTREVSGEVEIAGFTGTLAHVHAGSFGTNGSVLIPLEDHGGHGHFVVPANTVLTTAQVDQLHAGALYFNVHSATNPGGEIRGQIGRRVFKGTASGTQEVPSNASPASGTAKLVYDPQTRAIEGQITLTGMTATLAHIHMAVAGSNGPVIVPLKETTPGSGVWTVPSGTKLTAAQAQALLSSGLYFNAHSATFTTGEVRAQLQAL